MVKYFSFLLKYTFLIIVVFTCLSAGNTYAAEKLISSPDDEIAFAFFKLAGVEPPYEAMAMETKAYQDAPDFGKKIIVSNQINGIKNRFLNYDPATREIIVKIPVGAYFYEKQPVGLHLDFQNPDNVFFPYTVGGTEIALIPRGINKFKYVALSQEDTKAMGEQVENGTVILALRLRAIQADAVSPLPIMGTDRWLLMAKILTLDVMNTDQKILWSYHAPDYEVKKEKMSQQDVYWLHQK